MNAIIAEESVLRGWGAGFRAGLGAALADVTFFVLAALGVVGFVGRFPTVRGVMVGVGGLLMLYFAYGAAREAGVIARLRGRTADTTFLGAADGGADDESSGADVRPGLDGPDHADRSAESDGDEPPESDGGTGERIGGTGFRKAFVLALTNPYQILFWLT
ncbi:MAG: LysE family transporter, partial [Halobaculum sp.]